MTDEIKNWRDVAPPSLNELIALFDGDDPKKIENAAADGPEALRDFLVFKAVEMRTHKALKVALPLLSDTSPYRPMVASKLAKWPVEEADGEPLVQATLRDFVLHDPDSRVVESALHSLKRIALTRIMTLAAARAEDIPQVGRFHEMLVAYFRGLEWPYEFLLGPTVHAPAKAGPLKFLFTGDLWRADRTDFRSEVVPVFETLINKLSPDFGLLLGDSIDMSNLKTGGLLTPDEVEAEWLASYGALGLPFWACVGNKDWFGEGGPGGLLAIAQRPNSFNMPAISYSMTHGDVQFFAWGSHMTPSARRWLDHELATSKARWKIAFGHDRLDSASDLRAALAGRVDIYLSCHEELAHTRPDPSLHQFTSGTIALQPGTFGPVFTSDPAFITQARGIGEIEIDGDRATIRFVDTEGSELYRYEMEKPGA